MIWIQAFLQRAAGALERRYTLAAATAGRPFYTVALDASPWGLGAVLADATALLSYFAAPLRDEGARIFGHALGDSAGQQTWEAVVALEAVRTWRARLADPARTWAVCTDSASTLHLIFSMKAKGRGPGIIARELAL